LFIWEDNIKTDYSTYQFQGNELDSSGSRYHSVAGCYEHGN